MTDIEKLQAIIDNSDNIVFFGGAGVSTESGIPDFRSVDGLYSQKYGDVSPEEILSHDYFFMHPKEFYKFYRDKILMRNAEVEPKPNAAHLKLAELERAGKLKAVITQNIDTLHLQAGSKAVYQLHGTVAENYCIRCKKRYNISEIDKKAEGPMLCECGGYLKPFVVLYGESLPEDVWMKSVLALRNADRLIVAGTSLSVYPAASLLQYFEGSKLVVINRDSTPADRNADLVIHDSVGKVLEQIRV